VTAPLFTVVVPTRHRNDLLALCLERLAPGAQTLAAARYEVVVTDDGSETTAEAMVRERFPWARWVAGPRRGPGANRNHGARHGSAPWLAFTDDDCLPSPGWLAAFAAETGSGPRVLEGRTTCEAGLRSSREQAPVNLEGGWLWSCNMAVRREAFAALGGFDEEFPHAHMEDVDFRERALGRGEAIRFVPAAVVDHPPRPVLPARRLAATHESEFLFYYKAGRTGPYVAPHVRKLAGVRLRAAWQHRGRPREAAQTVASLLVEAAYVLRHGPAWEREYRERYAARERIAYPPDMAGRVGFG
jgi:glycosyltransferase involved in cell wall biosynthesis